MLKVGSLSAALSHLDDKVFRATVGLSIKGGGKFSTDLGGLLGVPAAATGGYITGPGTATSDSILARLSNGEYVINARATARHRQLLEQINSNRFASGGYVGGGSVSIPSSLQARFSANDLALLGQIVRHAGPMYAGDANFYGDGAAEREARKRRQMGGF
jgi:hypothetical protein